MTFGAEARRRFCLGCRTALGAEQACDACEEAPVLDLADGVSSREAESAVWDLRSERRRRHGLVALVLGGFTAAGVAVLFGGIAWFSAYGAEALDLHPESDVGTKLVFLWFGIMITGWLVLSRLVKGWEWHEVETRTPRGVPRLVAPEGLFEGIVDGLGEDTVGELVEVRCETGVTFRDGSITALVVTMDDGEELRLDAGRVRGLGLDGAEPLENEAREARLRLHGMGDATTLLVPGDEAWRWTLRHGDRVKVHATVSDQFSEEAGYRERAEPTKTVDGVPWLEPG